jgi:hypothetical protein
MFHENMDMKTAILSYKMRLCKPLVVNKIASFSKFSNSIFLCKGLYTKKLYLRKDYLFNLLASIEDLLNCFLARNHLMMAFCDTMECSIQSPKGCIVIHTCLT